MVQCIVGYLSEQVGRFCIAQYLRWYAPIRIIFIVLQGVVRRHKPLRRSMDRTFPYLDEVRGNWVCSADMVAIMRPVKVRGGAGGKHTAAVTVATTTAGALTTMGGTTTLDGAARCNEVKRGGRKGAGNWQRSTDW